MKYVNMMSDPEPYLDTEALNCSLIRAIALQELRGRQETCEIEQIPSSEGN